MPTFSDLKTRVKNYLIDVPTKTDALVGDWINKAIRDAERDHNFQHMRANVEQTTVDGTSALTTIPTRLKELRDAPFRIKSDGSLLEMGFIVSEADYHRQFVSTKEEDRDEPMQIYLDQQGGNFELLPIPDDQGDFSDNYKIHIPYWEFSASLANDGDTNWFTDNADWYVTFAAAAEGFLFNRDREEAQIAFGRAGQQLQKIVRADKRTMSKPPPMLVPRTSVFTKSRGLPRRG